MNMKKSWTDPVPNTRLDANKLQNARFDEIAVAAALLAFMTLFLYQVMF